MKLRVLREETSIGLSGQAQCDGTRCPWRDLTADVTMEEAGVTQRGDHEPGSARDSRAGKSQKTNSPWSFQKDQHFQPPGLGPYSRPLDSNSRRMRWSEAIKFMVVFHSSIEYESSPCQWSSRWHPWWRHMGRQGAEWRGAGRPCAHFCFKQSKCFKSGFCVRLYWRRRILLKWG